MLVLLLQGEEVAQGLGRMLMAAVAAVDDRDRRIVGGEPRRAVARMADDDQVGIVGDDPHRVGEALALGGRAGGRIGAGDGVAAQPQHGALERQPGAGRGLVEQRGQDEIGRHIGAAADPVAEIAIRQLVEIGLGDLEDGLDVLVGEIVDRDDMARRLGFHVRLRVLLDRWRRRSRWRRCAVRCARTKGSRPPASAAGRALEELVSAMSTKAASIGIVAGPGKGAGNRSTGGAPHSTLPGAAIFSVIAGLDPASCFATALCEE